MHSGCVQKFIKLNVLWNVTFRSMTRWFILSGPVSFTGSFRYWALFFLLGFDRLIFLPVTGFFTGSSTVSSLAPLSHVPVLSRVFLFWYSGVPTGLGSGSRFFGFLLLPFLTVAFLGGFPHVLSRCFTGCSPGSFPGPLAACYSQAPSQFFFFFFTGVFWVFSQLTCRLFSHCLGHGPYGPYLCLAGGLARHFRLGFSGGYPSLRCFLYSAVVCSYHCLVLKKRELF